MKLFRFIKNLFYRVHLIYLFIKLFFTNLYINLCFYPKFLKVKCSYYFLRSYLYIKMLYKAIFDYCSIYYQIRSNFIKRIFKVNFRFVKRLIPFGKYAQIRLKRFNLKIPDFKERRRSMLGFFYYFASQMKLAIIRLSGLGGIKVVFNYLNNFFKIRLWGLFSLFKIFLKRVEDSSLNLKTKLNKRNRVITTSNINISKPLLNKFYYVHSLLDEGVFNNTKDPFQVFNGKHPAYIHNYVAVNYTFTKYHIDSERTSVVPFGSDLFDFDYFPEAKDAPIYFFNYYEFDIFDRDLGPTMRKRFLYWLDLNYYMATNRPIVRSKIILQTRELVVGLNKKTKLVNKRLGETYSSLGELKKAFSISLPFSQVRRNRVHQANYYSRYISGAIASIWIILTLLAFLFFIFYLLKFRHDQYLWGIANTHFKHAVGLNYSQLSHWPPITKYNLNYYYFPLTRYEWNGDSGWYYYYIYCYGLGLNRIEWAGALLIALLRYTFMYTKSIIFFKKYIAYQGFTHSFDLDLSLLQFKKNVFLPSYKYFENPIGFTQLRSNLLTYLDLPVVQHEFFLFSIVNEAKDITLYYFINYGEFLFILFIPGFFYLVRVYVLPFLGFFSYESIFLNLKPYLLLFTRFYYYTESNSPLTRVFTRLDKRRHYYTYLYFLIFPRIKDKELLRAVYETIHPFSEEFLTFKFNYLAALREKFSSSIEERHFISQYYTNYWMWWLPSLEIDSYNTYYGDFLEAETDDELDEGGSEYLESEEIMKLIDINYQVAPLQKTKSFGRFVHKWNIKLFKSYNKTSGKGAYMFIQDIEAQMKEFLLELNDHQRAMWIKHSNVSSSLFREWYQKEFIEVYLKQMSLFVVSENEIHHQFKLHYRKLFKRKVNLHPQAFINLSRIQFRVVKLPYMTFDDPWNEDQSLSMIHYYDSSYFQKRISKGESILKAFSYYLFYRQKMFKKLRDYRRYFAAQEDAVMDPTGFKHTKIAIREFRRCNKYYSLYKIRLYNVVADATIRWDEYELESYYDHEQPLSDWFQNDLIAKVGVSDPVLSTEITFDNFVPETRKYLKSTSIVPSINQFYWAQDQYTTYLSSVEDSNETTEYLNFSEGVSYLVYVLNGYFATKRFSIFSEQEYILDTPLPEDAIHSIAEPGAPHPMYLIHSVSVLENAAGLPLKLNPHYPHEAQIYKKYRNYADLPHDVVNRWSVPSEKKYMYKLPANWRNLIDLFEFQYVNPDYGDFENLWLHEEDIWIYYPESYAWDTLL